nr:hypothetical protein [Tanacetum cinerariifolium]
MSTNTKKKGCKLHMMNRNDVCSNFSFMDRLPSNIVFNIFSKVPVTCLARSRCVSKEWCSYIDDRYLTIIHDKRVLEEPTPILYHPNHSLERICFHVIEAKQPGTTHYVLEPKDRPFLEYLRKEPLYIFNIQVLGSCNGLMCILQNDDYVITSLTVVHLLRKECYELPPFPLRFDKSMRRESCGHGFDTSTSTWKMVCVLLKEYAPPDKPHMAPVSGPLLTGSSLLAASSKAREDDEWRQESP